MPSRIIRDGWLESQHINALKPDEECFYLRLCLRADDFGRYHANPFLLKSNLFPLKENVRSTDIPRLLAACQKAGLVRCYEADAKPFLEIAKFGQRIKEGSRSKFPAPPPESGQVPAIPGKAGTVPPKSESESESDAKADAGGGNLPPASAVTVVVPETLNVPGFLRPWGEWVAIRIKGKKPKSSWDEYFGKQMAWLSEFGQAGAIESVSYSARNEYQGLFPPKLPRGGVAPRPNPAPPAMRMLNC